jgi:hypothetical protein
MYSLIEYWYDGSILREAIKMALLTQTVQVPSDANNP